MRLRGLPPIFCACVAILSCAPADDARELELQDALVSDHLDLLRRDPTQVAAKWEAMEADPFQFLRGSASLWARDASLPGGRANLPTLLAAPVFARVLLVGDPHPENFGTFLPLDGALTFDLNDFDAAREGPAHLDVRRLALGFAIALAPIDEELARAAAAAVARGWHAGLDGAVRVTPGTVPGHFIGRLFDKAARKGEERDELLSLTRLGHDGCRELNRLEAPPASAAAEYSLDVEPALREPLQVAVGAWVRARGAAELVDLVRVFGAGMGTRANLRFYALLADGQVLELKEARDPFVVHGLTLPQPRRFTDNGARVVEAEQTLQAANDADPMLGHLRLGAMSFVVHRESGWQRTLRTRTFREDLGADAASTDDVLELARRCGEVLGAAHARGSPALAEEQRLLDPDRLVEETVEFLDVYLSTAAEDHVRLAALRERHGPLLGWTP